MRKKGERIIQAIDTTTRSALDNFGLITLRAYLGGSETALDAEVVSAAYTASVGGGDGFSIGNACSAELVIVLAGVGATAGNQSLRVTWDVAGTEYPLFTGTVSKATTSSSQTTITAYDALDSASGTPYEPALTGSCTAAEALADIAEQMGVELDGDTKTLAAGTALTEGVSALDGLSLSSAAANIALLLGGNAIITRAGALAVRRFTDCGWETESYAGGATPEDTAYTVDGLTFQRTDTTTATDEDGITTESSSSTDYTASASSGAGLTYSTDLATQALVDGAYEALAGLSFRAGSFSVQGGLFVEPGDLIAVDGLTVAVSGISLSLDGGCKTTITSLGQSDTSSAGGSLTQAISAIQQDYAEFKTMVADNISATNARFSNLTADFITADEIDTYILNAGYITADSAVITDLTAEVANINSILAGNIGAGTVQTVHLTSENVVIDDAVITDAMIVNLTASKITSGTIYTNLVTVQSESGNLYITDNTIQIQDNSGTVRVQIGEDASGDYNLYLWDADGNLLWDAGGLYAAGIHDGIIKDVAVAEDAAISGTKLDIASVAECLNEDGSLTVNAAQITIDDTTLEYRLTSMTTATDEAAAAAQAAQDMAAALESESLSSLTQYYAVGDSADEPPSDPAEGVAWPAALADTAVVGESMVEVTDTDGDWTTEYPTLSEGQYLWTAFYVVYADETEAWTTPTCLSDGVAREAVSTLQTEFEVVQGQITAKVWQSDIDTAVSNISVGGRNYLLNTQTFDGWSKSSVVTLEEDDEGYTVATWAATSTLSWNSIASRDPIQFSLLREQTVTLSFDVRSDDFDSSDTSSSNKVVVSLALCTADSTTRTLYADTIVSRTSITTEWTRYTLTATLSDDYFTDGSGDIDDTTRFYVVIYNYALTSLQIRKVKLELGSIATDWTPAPEDTTSALTTLTDKYASVTVTLDSITDEVAELTTTVNDNYETLTSKMATLETTATSITATVRESTAIIGENIIADGTFEGYTTFGSAYSWYRSASLYISAATYDDISCICFMRGGASNSQQYIRQTVNLPAGTYIIKVKLACGNDNTAVGKVKLGDAEAYLCEDGDITDEWATFATSITITSAATYFYLYCYASVDATTYSDTEMYATDIVLYSSTELNAAMAQIEVLSNSISLCVTTDSDTGYLRLGTGDDGTVKFTVDADNLTIDEDGNVTMAGKVTATSGTVGGWNIYSTKICGTAPDGTTVAVMQISGVTDETAYIFACGESSYSHSSYKDCPFRVNKDGGMWVEEVVVAGSLAAGSNLSAGGNVTGTALVGGNDDGFYCKNTSGTNIRMAYLSNNDNVVLGHSDYATYINGSTIYANSMRVKEVQHGSVSISVSAANTPTSVDVTFPTAFSGTPDVVLSAATSSPATSFVGVLNPSSTGCTIYLTRTTTGAITVRWVAVY